MHVSTPSDLRRPAVVAVYGAAGHTGRFVIRELARRGLAARAVGRNPAALAAADFPADVARATASVDDPAALDRALAGADAVINCAGPFLDTAEPLVSAALRARLPYLDVTAEQASAQALFRRHDEAQAAGVAVVPAMSFYGGLADLLATAALGDWTHADEIRVAIALDSWMPTEGTRLTGRRNTVPRLNIRDGQLSLLGAPEPDPAWTFAAPFGRQEMVELPFSETILIARHLRTARLSTYLNTTPLRDLRDAATPPPRAIDASGRSAQTFRVEAEVRQGDQVRQAWARGQDIYAVTAPLVVEAAARLLASPPARGGVFAPGQLFDAPDFLAALAPDIIAGGEA